ncbi:hypothetical protein H0E87_004025 [Populus deltoides]|uniref:Uncharacterized protein n=1 Tax=Populus deltoides TaxID=3696 RepID=A0A8T2ZDN7_POPDE|nr:hypothetical protein H0E87_004025 [Populus deltoides]
MSIGHVYGSNAHRSCSFLLSAGQSSRNIEKPELFSSLCTQYYQSSVFLDRSLTLSPPCCNHEKRAADPFLFRIGLPAFDFYLLSTSILGSQKREIPNVVAASMDGFRLCCSELDAMEAKLASWSFAFVFETLSDHSSFDSFVGESASWTFAPTLLPRCLEKLRKEVDDHWCCEPVYAPSLDHGVGEPEEDGYLCEPSAYKVVIVEGNYLLLEDGAWKDVSSMFDEKLSVMFLLG